MINDIQPTNGEITTQVSLEGTDKTATVTATISENTILITVDNQPELTQRQAQKVWNMPAAEAINYRATLTLYKVVNGQKIAVTNADGTDRTAVITGNDIAVFDNLEAYENDELITYYIEETKIEKFVGIDETTGNEVWEDVTGKFIVNYKSN